MRLLLHIWLFTLPVCMVTSTIMAETIPLEQPLSQQGTISFVLKTDKDYFNGQGQEDYSQSLLKLPGVVDLTFRRTDPVVNLLWTWQREMAEGRNIFYDIVVDFAQLPGPERYHFLFTWDSALGRSEAYFNGKPLRVPGAKFEPWWVDNVATEIEIGEGALGIEQFHSSPRYLTPEQAHVAVPSEFMGRHARLIGFTEKPTPIDVGARRGKLLYESLLDRPESVEGWVGEGPVDLRFEGGHMLMRSVDFKQNIVFWCPEDFPESFVAEWEFNPLSHYGLAIVFFAATGENGEDIFAPSLPKRDGNFGHYIKGAITSYHISYFANIENFQMGRVDSNMRKNNKFYRVGGGPIAIPPGTTGWQHIRLVKDGNHIQLSANGRVSVDWTDDDPERYGPPHDGGKIGLRQMMPTIGAYRNFRVWALNNIN